MKNFSRKLVWVSIGIQESYSVKEKSDIIILGDSFDPIEKAMKWGRGVYNNIQIYAQFQLTATTASLVTDSVTTIFSGEPPAINIVTSISSGCYCGVVEKVCRYREAQLEAMARMHRNCHDILAGRLVIEKDTCS
ncbi:calcium-transporting ATPase 7, plasma membrane-type-like [Salvia miltiorrhiza]|uniref:calcium-transporting ATPase 7, plasma membrane-type-like n=1 Tax=Salvia miltiorrhiza TaxID=226208 RepID=UPI0025AD2656|nr:calcium-transporting ATPase 7, plasma membrane-type-like [Salvia miltiorrhiza]